MTSAATAPVVKITGPLLQNFNIRTGIRASAAVSVSCGGKALNWSWSGQNAAAVALLRSSGATTTSQQLFIKGPLSSVVHGQTIPLRVSARYTDSAKGVEPVTADVTFTAVGSDPVAKLSGPSGDWPETSPLVFNATTSYDPDTGGASSSQSLTYSWRCSLADGSSTPCFLTSQRGDSTTTPGVWTIPAGLLTSDTWYLITVTVSKAAALGSTPLSSTSTITFRPRSAAKPFPQGALSRACSLAGCSGLHSTDMPLMLSLLLDGNSGSANVSWSCAAVPAITNQALQMQGSTGTSRMVVIPASLLPTNLPRITITATMNLNGVEGIATLTVGLNSAPYCSLDASSPLACLSLDVRNDTAPYATIVARAVGWADSLDDQLRYEFGVRGGNSSQDQMRTRGSATSATLTGLPAGAWEIYVCAIDTQGSRSCTRNNVTVKPPSASFDAAKELASLDVAATSKSNDMGALVDLANRVSAMMSSLTPSSNTTGNSTADATQKQEKEKVIAEKTASIANALLTSLNGVQDPEQVLQTMTSIAAMAGSAAELLPDSSRTVYVDAAKMATSAILSSTSTASTTELLSSLADICRLLSTSLPRGAGSTSNSGRRLLQSATTSAARSSLADLLSLGGQLGGTMGQRATPGGGYVAGGDQGVYVSAVVIPTSTAPAGSISVSLRAGQTAAIIANGGVTSQVGVDVEAQLVLAGQVAVDASSYTVVLQYAPSSSAAVTQATTGLLDASKTTLGGLATISWTAPSTASGTPQLDGESNYLVVSIPVSGFNTSRSTSCMVYNPTAVTLSEESGSFVSFNATTGLVTCRVTKLGSYIVTQGAALVGPSPPPPPPSPPPPPLPPATRVFTITMLFSVDSADRLATETQQNAFRSNLTAALADIYQVAASAVTLSSAIEVRADKTVQVFVSLIVPTSRPEDGGAAAGFEADPKSKLPASLITTFGIIDVKVQRGQQNNAVVPVQYTPPAGSQQTNAISGPSNNSKKRLSGGAVAGIVVGSIAGAVAIVVLAFLIIQRRKRSRVAPGATSSGQGQPIASRQDSRQGQEEGTAQDATAATAVQGNAEV
ncbi:hypothetical protein PLESTF_000971100 [Pleodorina starrii]|nr:hypothetical protein PLESTF_000971100 [Pleodorina starrii]